MSKDPKHFRVHVTLKGVPTVQGETLWATKQPGRARYKIRNIPFLAYGLNMGDVVRTEMGKNGMREVVEVVKVSGNRTLRAVLLTDDRHDVDTMVKELQELGVVLEGGFSKLLAIHVPPEVNYDAVCGVLDRWTKETVIEWETAEERGSGRFDEWQRDGAG